MSRPIVIMMGALMFGQVTATAIVVGKVFKLEREIARCQMKQTVP